MDGEGVFKRFKSVSLLAGILPFKNGEVSFPDIARDTEAKKYIMQTEQKDPKTFARQIFDEFYYLIDPSQCYSEEELIHRSIECSKLLIKNNKELLKFFFPYIEMSTYIDWFDEVIYELENLDHDE